MSERVIERSNSSTCIDIYVRTCACMNTLTPSPVTQGLMHLCVHSTAGHLELLQCRQKALPKGRTWACAMNEQRNRGVMCVRGTDALVRRW